MEYPHMSLYNYCIFVFCTFTETSISEKETITIYRIAFLVLFSEHDFSSRIT